MPSVQIKENEHFEYALRRFKRACEQADIINEVRKRGYYEKPTWARKRLKAQAVKRLHKQLALSRKVL